jgi:hypothetical protein
MELLPRQLMVPIIGPGLTVMQPVGPVPPSLGTFFRIAVEETFGWQRPVTSITSTPPASPSKGNRYIVGVAATGVWAGRDGNIAWYDGLQWQFDIPGPGWGVFNIATSGLYFRIAGAWTLY